MFISHTAMCHNQRMRKKDIEGVGFLPGQSKLSAFERNKLLAVRGRNDRGPILYDHYAKFLCFYRKFQIQETFTSCFLVIRQENQIIRIE